mmetsp:Transcript_14594/g.29370  ORF Transcript_14594/g.29370 Transcript_14594/m.29370 type:complete len:398 (+) Transcript_14594:278-1471(+)
MRPNPFSPTKKATTSPSPPRGRPPGPGTSPTRPGQTTTAAVRGTSPQGRSPSPGRGAPANGGGAVTRTVQPTRRRLSVMGQMGTGFEADGAVDYAVTDADRQNLKTGRGGIVESYAAKSKVGLVPMNPNKVNQDSHFELEAFAGDPSQYFFCVMDGHGLQGKEVSDMIRRRLPANVQADPQLRTDPKTALTRGYLKTNTELSRSALDISFSGSTTIGVFMRGSTLFSANVGDSRAVLGRLKNGKWTAVALSDDHKPDRPDEKARILKANGRVEAFKGPDGEDIGPPRVWLKHQDAPGLAMARSMGDAVAATVGVIAEPEIQIHELEPEDKFMVLASDGVWEFISNEEVVQYVQAYWQKKDPQAACDFMVSEANRRWRKEEEVIDDTTVIVVFLNVPG